MKYNKTITLLVLGIVVLSFIATSSGIFSRQGPGKYDFKSLHGETVTIHGKGLYQNDSVSMAAQGIAQDWVTLFLGIPLLVISFYLAGKGLRKGKLLLTGTLGYFLYTYASLTFLAMYNPFFLIYVTILSASFFAFTLAMMSFDGEDLSSYFNPKLPVKFLGGFLIFLGIVIGLMWLGKIIPSLIGNTPPVGLEHYTTLVIQALDLGFVVPVALLSGILLIKRKPFGYLLSSVIIIKGITLLTAISAMVIGMIAAGVRVNLVEITVFPLFNLATIYGLFLIMKNVREVGNNID